MEDDLIPDYLKSEIDNDIQALIKENKALEERILKISLKIRYGEDFKIFPCLKTDTLMEVVLRAIQDYRLEDFEP